MFAALCFGILLLVLEDSCLHRTDGSGGRSLEIRPGRSEEMKTQGNSLRWGMGGGGVILKLQPRENGEDGHSEGIRIFPRNRVEGWSKMVGGNRLRLADGENL